ncbi:MAG TPA: Uma2 family endonuclease [Actinomycetota bacterium]
MATQPQTGLTYQDLESSPEDNLRRELIDGELIVTAAPATRHQRVVLELGAALLAHVKEHGGDVFVAPTDVFFSDTNVVEPDVLYVRPEHVSKVEQKFVRSAPDLVVEVSSPNSRRLELVRKRELYERFGVPEYWYVDLDADRVEIYRLHDERYGSPALRVRGDRLDSPMIPGFGVEVDDLLGPAESIG